MDFSGLNKAALKQKDFEENKGPEFINKKGEGRYVMMFDGGEEKQTRKFIPYIQLNFTVVKVLEGGELKEGEAAMMQIHPGDYYMDNIAKWIHQITGTPYSDIDSDTGTAFVSKGITDLPVTIVALKEEYDVEDPVTKEKIHKSYVGVNATPLSEDEAKSHGLDIESPLW